MSKKSKHSLGALMALTLSANLLSHPLDVKAEEVETDTATESAVSQEISLKAVSTPQAAEVQETEAEAAEPAIQQRDIDISSEEEIEASLTMATIETAGETETEANPQVNENPILLETEIENSNSDSVPVQETESLVNPVASSSAAVSSTAIHSAAQNVIIPAYKYADPSDPYWERITALGGIQIPYVIINPSNGSGNQAIDNFAQQIAANQSAGIKNLGYINTKGFSRSQEDLLAEADRYTSFYGAENIAGFFFDEAKPGESQEQVDYMRSLYQSVKSRYPHMTVLGWP